MLCNMYNNILRNKTQKKITICLHTKKKKKIVKRTRYLKNIIVAFMPKKKVRGRKTNWSNNITDDPIDIILDDEKLKNEAAAYKF